MADITGGAKTTQATVTITLDPTSITVNDQGQADILYLRTITDTSSKELYVRDTVRVTEELPENLKDVTDGLTYFLAKKRAAAG